MTRDVCTAPAGQHSSKYFTRHFRSSFDEFTRYNGGVWRMEGEVIRPTRRVEIEPRENMNSEHANYR